MTERYRELRESAEIRWNNFTETNPRLSRMIAKFTKISYRYGKSLGIFLAYFYISIEILTFTVFLLNVIFAESYIIQGDIEILSSSVSLNSTVKFAFFFIPVIFYSAIILLNKYLRQKFENDDFKLGLDAVIIPSIMSMLYLYDDPMNFWSNLLIALLMGFALIGAIGTLTYRYDLKIRVIILGIFLILMFDTLFTNYSYNNYRLGVFDEMRSPSAFANIFTFALPIALAATGAAFNERSGVINIGLEGIMLAGAFGGVYFTYLSGNPWIGVLGAIAVGGFIGLVHAVLTISFKSEQIVTGVAINFLAAGITGLLTALIWREGASDLVEKMPIFNYLKVPVLGDALGLLSLENFNSIPLLGFVLSKFPDFIVVLNRQSYLFYLALLIIPICHILLFKTTIGLRIRTIGENPEAAATAGINVHLYQYASVIFSGMLCGLGGSMISLELGIFTPELTLGKGFYALAVMIFGKWTIIGSVLAAFLFGAFQTISIKLAVDSITSPVSGDVPPQFLQMVPNIFAILAVAGIIGRAYPPKSLGKPYDPSESE